MNNKNRAAINEDYLSFIRRLPCAAKGKTVVHVHHADPTGIGGNVRNDYYAVPLNWQDHVGKTAHMTDAKLSGLLGERVEDRVIFYLSLYIEHLEGKYDIEADECCQFYELRKKLK